MRTLLLSALVLVVAGCTRPSDPIDPAPSAAKPSTPLAKSVQVRQTAFKAGDRFEVTSRLTLAQDDTRVETSCRYEVRVESCSVGKVRATITVMKDETVIADGERTHRTAHPARTIRFEGSPRELALIGTRGKGALVSTHLPPELLRDGVRDGAIWSGARRLQIAGLPVELGLRSLAQLRADGRIEVTTTSRAEREAQHGVTLTIEGEAVSCFDRDRADLPRTLTGRFTTLAAGGPGGEDARSTVAIEVQTRRLS